MRNTARKRRKELQRRRKDRQGQLEQARQEKRAIDFLKQIGVWQDLKKFHLDRKVFGQTGPKISVQPAQETPACPKAETIVRELRTVLKDTRFELPRLNCSVPIQEYAAVIAPMADALLDSRAADASLEAVASRVRQAAEPFVSEETTVRFSYTVWSELREILVKHSRINHAIYYLSVSNKRPDHVRHHLNLELNRVINRAENICIDGKSRPAYRCGQAFDSDGIDWADWDASLLGLDNKVHRFPVYVQQHALDQLHGPRGRFPVPENQKYLLHDALWDSLKHPAIHQGHDANPCILVEYRVQGYKFGYLVVRPLSDKVLVQTFLLLTMDGTPEAAKLRDATGMVREDKSFLGLDKLMTFAGTDLASDPQLASLLRDCGCGDLMDAFSSIPSPRTGVARRIREYLGLGEHYTASENNYPNAMASSMS